VSSLRRALCRAVLTSVAVVAAVAAGYAVGSVVAGEHLPPTTVVTTDTGVGVAEARAARVERLVSSHDCWTGTEQPPPDLRGGLPGHVVATPAPTSGRPTPWPTYSARLVGPALDQVFGERDRGLAVHAFCR
jgi:hypothetical protein